MTKEVKEKKLKFKEVIEAADFVKNTNYKIILRQMVRGFYDIQTLRISIGNKLCANFYVKVGVKPGEKKDKADPWGKKIIEYYTQEYNLLSEFVAGNTRRLKAALSERQGIITSKVEFAMIQTFLGFLTQEKFIKDQMEDYLENFPIWTEWMKHVCGLGPLSAGVMISEYNIFIARYVSSMWRYAGLDVFEGEGRCRKAHHLVEQKYTDKNGKPATKMGLSFNPFLKTKLLGVLAPSLVKQHKKRLKKDGIGLKYGSLYYDYKERKIHEREVKLMSASNEDEEKAIMKEWPDIRIHQASNRYMVKILIQDLYPVWKTIEGLPVVGPYAERKLGMDISHHTVSHKRAGTTL